MGDPGSQPEGAVAVGRPQSRKQAGYSSESPKQMVQSPWAESEVPATVVGCEDVSSPGYCLLGSENGQFCLCPV